MDKLHGGNETENTSNMTSTDNVRTEVDTLMHIFCPRTGSGVPCLDPWRRGCAVLFFSNLAYTPRFRTCHCRYSSFV